MSAQENICVLVQKLRLEGDSENTERKNYEKGMKKSNNIHRGFTKKRERREDGGGETGKTRQNIFRLL